MAELRWEKYFTSTTLLELVLVKYDFTALRAPFYHKSLGS